MLKLEHLAWSIPGGESIIKDIDLEPVSYTHLTLPTSPPLCRSRWSPYH